MSSEPPEPLELGPRGPLIHVWPRGARFFRCHDVRLGATEFNPGLGGVRFHPLRTAEGVSVPTLYGSDTIDGALSETVFHNVPLRGAWRGVRGSTLTTQVLSAVAARRDLKLAQLHGHGLRRLRISRRELLDSEADSYAATRRWAEALYRSDHRIDGLVWVSRQHDTSLALMLFGDRVERAELEEVEPPLPLAWGRGLRHVQQAAEAADIVILL